MKYLSILLLFFSITVYSQENKLEILLRSDSIIETNWIKLHELPFLGKPHVRIDHKRGSKIRIEDIAGYKGEDQFGNYRQLHRPDRSSAGYSSFTETWFRSDSIAKCKIFYNRFLFSGEGRPSTIKHTFYQMSNSPIRPLNYTNIRQDLSSQGTYSRHLKRAGQIRFLQFASVAVATGLLATLIRDKWPSPGDRSLQDKHNALFFTSGCLVAFSLYLEIPKKKQLVKALKLHH